MNLTIVSFRYTKCTKQYCVYQKKRNVLGYLQNKDFLPLSSFWTQSGEEEGGKEEGEEVAEGRREKSGRT